MTGPKSELALEAGPERWAVATPLISKKIDNEINTRGRLLGLPMDLSSNGLAVSGLKVGLSPINGNILTQECACEPVVSR